MTASGRQRSPKSRRRLLKLGALGLLSGVGWTRALTAQPTGKPAPAEAQSPARSSTKAIEWRLVSQYPVNFPGVIAFNDFAKRVRERSNGRLVINTYPAGQLYTGREVYDAVRDGRVQLAYHAITLGSEMLPVLDMFSIPFLFGDLNELLDMLNGELGARLTAEVTQRAQLVPIYFDSSPSAQFVNRKRTIRKPEDLKGLLIRSVGKPDAVALARWGAAPVTISSAEQYEALQRGTIDGAITGVIYQTKLHEVTKFASYLDLWAVPFWVFANQQAWQALPDDLKTIVLQVGKEISEQRRKDVQNERITEIQRLQETKMEVTILTPAERKVWQDEGAPYLKTWADSRGQAAKDMLAIVEKHRSKR